MTPKLGEGVGLGGRVWHPQKARHDGHTMTIENETLSLSVYEPIAMQFFAWGDRPPILGSGLS